MPYQRRARAVSALTRIYVKHVDIAAVKECVIQHAVSDDLVIGNRDKTVAARHFTPDILAPVILALCDEIDRAKLLNITFCCEADRDHVLLAVTHSTLQRPSRTVNLAEFRKSIAFPQIERQSREASPGHNPLGYLVLTRGL